MTNSITVLFVASSIVKAISAFRPSVGHFAGRSVHTTYGRGTGGCSCSSPFPYRRQLSHLTCATDGGSIVSNANRVISSEFQASGEPHSLFRVWNHHELFVAVDHPLADALKHVGCESLCHGKLSTSALLTNAADNTTLGSLNCPDINKLISIAKPSPFGKDNETLYDETVRKGVELTANQFNIQNEDDLLNEIKPHIKKTLFPDAADISFKRYKMAIYQDGGHFDVHRDSLHAHNHQATLLVEVKSDHEGGTLIIQQDNKVHKEDFSVATSDGSLRWVAFYTDLHHKVEKVTNGTRLMLQYDIYVDADEEEEEKEEEKEEAEEEEYDEEDEEDDEQRFEDLPPFHYCNDKEKLPNKYSFPRLTTPEQKVILSALEANLDGSDEAVAIPLFHLYTTQSIKANYLKNADRQLLQTILSTGKYEVGLIPIIVEARSNYERMFDRESISDAYVYTTQPMDIAYVGYENRNDESGGGVYTAMPINEEHPLNSVETNLIITNNEIARTLSEAHCNDYREHKYFQSVMIVRKKDDDDDDDDDKK